MTIKTYGETLFEDYLRNQGIAYEYEPPLAGTTRRVDFVVEHPEKGKILFEVKDIVVAPPGHGPSAIHPYVPIRNHIKAGQKKFKELPDALCALVLAAPPGSFVDIESPHFMLGAMYGDYAFRVPFAAQTGQASAPDGEWFFQPGKGQMVRRSGFMNTRIAALISLLNYDTFQKEAVQYVKAEDGRSPAERWSDVAEGRAGIKAEPTPCVIVWENAVSDRRLPRELFRGEMDAWWTIEGGFQELSFAGEKRKRLSIDR